MASIVANLLGGNALGGVAQVINSIRGKNPEDAAKLAQINADLEALHMKYDAEFRAVESDLAKGQQAVNLAEASNQSVFVAGWRPGVGWVCSFGLFSQFIIAPFATWAAALAHHPIAYPQLDLGTLMTLLFGLLGLGGMRTFEKVNGVNSGH